LALRREARQPEVPMSGCPAPWRAHRWVRRRALCAVSRERQPVVHPLGACLRAELLQEEFPQVERVAQVAGRRAAGFAESRRAARQAAAQAVPSSADHARILARVPAAALPRAEWALRVAWLSAEAAAEVAQPDVEAVAEAARPGAGAAEAAVQPGAAAVEAAPGAAAAPEVQDAPAGDPSVAVACPSPPPSAAALPRSTPTARAMKRSSVA
jgi:hypothetical protein